MLSLILRQTLYFGQDPLMTDGACLWKFTEHHVTWKKVTMGDAPCAEGGGGAGHHSEADHVLHDGTEPRRGNEDAGAGADARISSVWHDTRFHPRSPCKKMVDVLDLQTCSVKLRDSAPPPRRLLSFLRTSQSYVRNSSNN